MFGCWGVELSACTELCLVKGCICNSPWSQKDPLLVCIGVQHILIFLVPLRLCYGTNFENMCIDFDSCA